jgi:O-antigen/teichoic acid export membrane protein
MGFFTLLSMRPRGRHFFTAYASWTFGVQMIGTLVFLALAPASLLSKAWQGQSRGLLILAFTAVFLSTQGWNSVIQLGEAQRRTFFVQLVSTGQALVHLALLAFAAISGYLTLNLVLLLLTVEFTILMVLTAPPLVKMSIVLAPVEQSWQNVIRDFVDYCRPVAVYGYVGFIYTFADRWLLQHFGGAAQQGLFAFAQQFGAISILATAAMMNVFWKEIAEARAFGNLDRLRELYVRSRRALFFTAAWTSCLLIPWSGQLLVLAVGSQYASGALVLTLMFLYPVHQSLGQLQSTFLIATGETRLYATIGLVAMTASIIAAYFLLASPSANVPGFGLGAVGLAGKMVGLQLIQVLFMGVVISRKYHWPYDIGHQFSLLVGLLLLSFAVRSLIQLLTPGLGTIGQLIIAVVVYTACTGMIIWKFPELAGFNRNLVAGFLHAVVARVPTIF